MLAGGTARFCNLLAGGRARFDAHGGRLKQGGFVLDLTDIQGIALSSYTDKPHARFVFLGFDASARAFFSSLMGRVTNAQSPKPAELCLNIAFTAHGLAALGLSSASLASFSAEFAEGMAGTPKRSEILGDTLASAPDTWLWGGPVDTGRCRVDALRP